MGRSSRGRTISDDMSIGTIEPAHRRKVEGTRPRRPRCMFQRKIWSTV